MLDTLPRSPQRRRLYLMRHGAVTYFDGATGRPVLPEQVSLNEDGVTQARAAGDAFRSAGVRFDRVIVSGLPRTVQTAELVLRHADQTALSTQVWPEWQEIRGGRLGEIPPDELVQAFTGLQRSPVAESQRFLNGESIAELLDRVLGGIARLRADPDWDCALLVLHGVVNAAILSHAVSGGQRLMLGSWVQSPACINVLDVGEGPGDWLLRVANYAALQPLHADERSTTMEALFAQYLRYRSQRG
ncbi:histidine phosphatase family protein [Roseateles amylovorans]|uniref:Histidine phosphatase family protein n=1 Tax=Roseateles amylovorans TaxID=2978473 RepID=A0ABY6AYV4_9BURK|nr:histidine phosphatase family protein [Roseateles amylovorans]UXH78356.1 histidine phosphatase family protein [Roseateles amylovorans]